MDLLTHKPQNRTPWNKSKLVGQKPPLTLKEVCAIRIHLQIAHRIRDLALFNLAIDSKLRSCDLVKLRVKDVTHGGSVAKRAMVMQKETQRRVRYEITEHTRDAISRWIVHANLSNEDNLFTSRLKRSSHISTRQYARIVGS